MYMLRSITGSFDPFDNLNQWRIVINVPQAYSKAHSPDARKALWTVAILSHPLSLSIVP